MTVEGGHAVTSKGIDDAPQLHKVAAFVASVVIASKMSATIKSGGSIMGILTGESLNSFLDRFSRCETMALIGLVSYGMSGLFRTPTSVSLSRQDTTDGRQPYIQKDSTQCGEASDECTPGDDVERYIQTTESNSKDLHFELDTILQRLKVIASGDYQAQCLGKIDSTDRAILEFVQSRTSNAPSQDRHCSDVSPSVSTLPWQQNKVHIDDIELASWSFDPFAQCNVDVNLFGQDLWDSSSVSGVPMALQMLQFHGILEQLKLNAGAMERYLQNIELAYPRNPYHNRIHALDVMQSCHAVLVSSEMLVSMLDPVEKMSLLIGAFIHDVGHPGVNNKLLMRLADDPTHDVHPELAKLAIRYSNKSVCESYHIATAFEVAFENGRDANPFLSLSSEDFARLRALMIELVLATDMEQHFNLIGKMKATFGTSASHARSTTDIAAPEKKLLMLQAILHACDISNPAKPIKMCKKWCVAVTEEFYRQGDLEIASNLTPDKMHVRCDLTSKHGRAQQANGQLAFIKFIVRPLHEVLAHQLPIFRDEALPCIETNAQFWEEFKKESDGSRD